MNINGINRNRITTFLSKAGDRIMESKVGNAFMPENATDLAKALALYSTTTKDAVNCYYYTTQSYNNKKIPEDKRKFVAGIDLANGILNVITQLTLGLYVNKHSSGWFNKLFKGGFVVNDSNAKQVAKTTNEILSKAKITENIKCSPEQVKSAVKGLNKGMKGGFGVILVLLVTQIVAKRMIVPFLSTPLAGKFKQILEKKEQDAKKAEGNTQPAQQEVKSDDEKVNESENSNNVSAQVNQAQDTFEELIHKHVKFEKEA